jgi:hypothetical protein
MELHSQGRHAPIACGRGGNKGCVCLVVDHVCLSRVVSQDAQIDSGGSGRRQRSVVGFRPIGVTGECAAIRLAPCCNQPCNGRSVAVAEVNVHQQQVLHGTSTMQTRESALRCWCTGPSSDPHRTTDSCCRPKRALALLVLFVVTTPVI